MLDIATGKGGKTYEDRQLAGRVRTLALEEIEKILHRPKHKLYGAVIIKLAGTVLPRLNEHSGPEGKPIPLLSVLDTPANDVLDNDSHEENTEAE